jgi:V/A-type H+/Na+-transporting ATPase subunit E
LALEDILRALEEKAEVRIQGIQAEAEQRVVEIISEVERDAEHTRRVRARKVEEAVRSESAAIVYSASLKAKNQLIKAQEETVDEAFRMAEQRLRELHKDESYPAILEILLDEVLEFFEGEAILQVRPEDRSTVEGLMAERNLKYRISEVPLEASGGVIASAPDGDVIVYNTFESRLEKARDKLRLAISNTLFGAKSQN